MPDGILDRERKVWFPHKTEVWALGDVTSADDSPTLKIVDSSGATHCIAKKDTEKFDPTHLDDYDDVATLNNLNQAPLLSLLRRRYLANSIYTNVSNISISFNPYAWIEGLYDNPKSALYSGKGGNGASTPRVPHVYSVASVVFERMLTMKEDQSVIVSGESGAGKTEACKKVMKYLAESSVSSVSGGSGEVTIEQKVMDCNPFLEAFGNAKTVRNDNSSRFGKFIKIEYDGPRIVGATMNHYLLEKSRVICAGNGERNYHIFYQLCIGATEKMKAKLHLKKPAEYRILNQGELTVEGVDDKQEFEEVCRALRTVGATQEQVDSMFELIAGLLQLGNVQFSADSEDNASISPASHTDKSITLAMDLLNCPVLSTKLTSRIVKAKGRASVYTVQLTKPQAEEARDALAKAIYDNLFGYLIQLCNETLQSPTVTSMFIGILDIFGFEIFKINSFEQLCINYANEKLQSLFNHTVFVAEQEMYKREGIDCAYIEFQNNQGCVDMIEKKPIGILPVLDEICMLGRNTDTDMTFLTKLNNAHRGKTKDYGVSRMAGNDSFIVKHFAGDVTYCVDSFICKNSDKLLPDLESAMLESKSDFVRLIFENANKQPVARSRSNTSINAGAKAPTTIGYKFKNQLGGLYNEILSTHPHYIRCVKPNNNKKALEFDAVMVMEQLRCNGTLEMVRIRREGYPMREEWTDLWEIVKKFEYWKEARVDPKSDPKVGCPEVFKKALPSGYFQVAASGKVFMKFDTYDVLADWKIATNAILVQSKFRAWHARKTYKNVRRRIIALQRGIGGFMARQKYKKHVVKITKCQALIRQFVVSKVIVKRKRALKVLDERLHAFLVGKREKEKFKQTKESVLRIQTIQRGRKGRKEYEGMLYQKFVAEENKKKDEMASVIGGRLKKKAMGSKLETWVQEAFSAASWGDNEHLKVLVTCSTPEWAVLREVKSSLSNVRDRMDGMKTLLHVCAINGNSEGIQCLLENGALVDVMDSEGNTPLLRSTGCGDSHLAVSKKLVENCEKKVLVAMLNRVNAEQHSAMDVALAEGSESDDGSAETVKLLLNSGAKSGKGTAQDKIKQTLANAEKKQRDKEEYEERREKEMLEAARKERELDPHFQFMKMQQNVDDTASSAAKLEAKRKERQNKKEEEQAGKREKLQQTRVKRRVSARQSIFNSGGLLGKGKNLLGENVGSGGGSFEVGSSIEETEEEEGETVAEMGAGAEAKEAPKAKVKRRVSAKVTDNRWAVKSNVPYRLIAKTVDAESKDGGSEGEGARGSALSKTDSIIEEEEEEEEAEEVVKEAVKEVVEKEAEEPPAEPVLDADTASKYGATLAKLTQVIQDMSTAADRKGWYYLNTDGGEEGPFASEWMHSWLTDKALNGSTQIRFGDGLNFVQLSSIIPECDEVTIEGDNPFVLDAQAQVGAVQGLLAAAFKQ